MKTSFTMAIYDKENMSKIQMAIEFIKSLPKPVNEGYVLCDSWYSNKKLFAVSKESGYTYIGALRTNRVIYPKGREKLGIKLNHMYEILTEDDVDLKVQGTNPKKNESLGFLIKLTQEFLLKLFLKL
ncbi:transposase [Clostridium estertheticum]|uniref:transposase n=1 Tax=Clostridium estertheticum TaxID=238834 RepID=UPI0014785DA5|nr:transposase [Clostridium estertheticum]MBU3171918.1 transposase [Clostridium estertheticum]MBZ9618367.1 transposase [Clostridium estertheticum subsp. laramiense]WAG76136.1 transposase [Clostridium estertheticum]